MSNASYHIEIGPHDNLNPRAGYRVLIRDRAGRVILDASTHPLTGADLTAQTALEVAAHYLPKGEQS